MKTYILLVDFSELKIGCPLLQTAHLTDYQSINYLFDPEDWFLFPTPDMRLVEGTLEQFQFLAKRMKNDKN